MTSEQKITAETKPRRKVFKAIKWILIVSTFVVLLLFFGVPLFLSSSGGTGFLLNKINSTVDGQVQMDDFSIGWFKGIKLTKLSYADSTGNTSVAIDRVETQPKYMSLLGGKVNLGKTIVDRPHLYLRVPMIQDVVSVSEKAASSEEKSDAPPPVFPVNQIDLELINGTATIELTGDVPQTVSFTNIASIVQIADAGKQSVLDISMDVDDSSKISAKGTATPSKKGWTLKEGDFEVQISKLQLASLKPLFALAGQEMDMAGELNADTTIQIKDNQIQQLKADAVISDFAQGSGTQRTVFDQPVKLSALISGDEKAINIERARVESAFCTVNCTGTTENLNYDIKADLAQTQRFAGQFADMQGLAMEGDLSVQGEIHLTEGRVGVNGTGKIQRLIAEKDGVQTPVTDVQMDFDCALDKTANQFQLASINVKATPGTINIANVVLPLSKEAAKTISADAQASLDLTKTWPFVQVFADLPKDVQLAGMLDSAVKVSTEGSRVRLLTDKTQIEQLKITRPDSEPFQQEKVSLNADIVLDTDNQTIDIQKLNMEAADGQSLIKITKGKVEKKISKDTTKLSGDFQAQYDLKTISAFASAYLPEGLILEGERSDVLYFDSQYPTDHPEMMNANLNANGTFGFSKAEYNGLNIGSTEMKLNIVSGVVDFTIPETTVNEGKMQFAGTMDIKENPRFFRLKGPLKEPMPILQNVQVNDTLTRNLLMYTNPVFADAVRTSGVASFSCQKLEIPLSKDDLNQMAIQGTFEIESLKLQAGDFLGQILTLANAGDSAMLTVHPTDFTLEKGYLSYQDMQIDIGKTPIHFEGKIGLDKSLAMNVQIPVSDRSVRLPIEGTLTKPKINTAKLIESQGRQLIEQEVQKQLERLFK